MKPLSVWILLLVTVLASAGGCQPGETISTQRVPKEQSGYLSHRQNPTSSASISGGSKVTLTPEQMTDRMLVAIYPLESAMWFFKVNGSIEQIKPWDTKLVAFFESIKFEDGSPTWQLPEDWSEGESRPMRFATLRIGDSNPPLELSISSLPAPQDVLLNINRWRGQMGLSGIQQDELANSTKPLVSSIDQSILFDVVGKFGGGMMGSSLNGPMANTGGLTPPRSQTGSEAIQKVQAKVQAKAPAEWIAGQTSMMVPIRYQKTVGEASAQITVIPLPAAANEWEPNLKRWAGEVELLDLTSGELNQRTEDIEVDGVSGKLVRLIPNDEKKSKGTIGVMVKHGNDAWFVKLSGDRKIVAESEETFLEFLKTIQLPSAE